jgi:hypothetical protein
MQRRKMKIHKKREGTCLYGITSQKTVFLNLYLLVKESGKQISFTNTKMRAERIQDVHENNILNVNVNVVNTLEITHIADSYQCKQNIAFDTREWFGVTDVGGGGGGGVSEEREKEEYTYVRT